MKSPTLLLSLLAGTLATAQDDNPENFPGQPSCAIPCLASAIPVAGCAVSDVACQCGPARSSAIGGLVLGCFTSRCSGAGEIDRAVSAGAAACRSFSDASPGQITASLTSSSSGTAETLGCVTPTPTPTGSLAVSTMTPNGAAAPAGLGSRCCGYKGVGVLAGVLGVAVIL
ncbi:hypothetical protein F5X96DRAFT_690439 [Biscogniauxia mediterranea]|nr:hypothetical protein F5X96DRAFT_690439 [Biscogniauxia mediterranea]